MSYCTVVGTGIVRVLRWVVCCVFEGFLEVIVRAADHGDTLFTGHPGTRVPGYPAGYPAAGYPIRKSRRVLGRTRTRSRVLPVRVFTRVVNERVAPLPRSTVLVIKMIEAWVSGTSMKAANGGTSSSHSSNSSIAVRASQSERVAPLPRSTARSTVLVMQFPGRGESAGCRHSPGAPTRISRGYSTRHVCIKNLRYGFTS